MTPPVSITSAAIQLADVVDSLALTEHGKARAADPRTRQGVRRLVLAAALQSPVLRAAEVSRALHRCGSLVAVPEAEGKGAAVRTVNLCRGPFGTPIATVRIPARHLDGNPTPRELARVVADLLR